MDTFTLPNIDDLIANFVSLFLCKSNIVLYLFV